MSEFETIKSSLEGLPSTWYPELLKHLVIECIKQEVFKTGSIAVFVRGIEAPVSSPELDAQREMDEAWRRTTRASDYASFVAGWKARW